MVSSSVRPLHVFYTWSGEFGKREKPSNRAAVPPRQRAVHAPLQVCLAPLLFCRIAPLATLSFLFVLPCNGVFCRPVDLTLFLSLNPPPLLHHHLPAAFSAQLTEQPRCHRRRCVPAALPRDLLEVEPPGVKCRCSACLSVWCRGSFARKICGGLSPLHSSGSGLKRCWVIASHHHHL